MKNTYGLHGTLSEARVEAELHIRARLAELNNTTPDRIHSLRFSSRPVTRQRDPLRRASSRAAVVSEPRVQR